MAKVEPIIRTITIEIKIEDIQRRDYNSDRNDRGKLTIVREISQPTSEDTKVKIRSMNEDMVMVLGQNVADSLELMLGQAPALPLLATVDENGENF